MVIDTSAAVAIILDEPEHDSFARLVVDADVRMMSAASVLETYMVLESRSGEAAGREFELFLVKADIEVVSVDHELVEAARSGWRKYGKRRHRAALNFGDCFAYALAKISGEPLLAKGNAFPQTDIPMCTDKSLAHHLAYSPLPSANVISVFCSSSCAFAEPVAGVELGARLMLRSLEPSIRFSRGVTNESAPMFAGSSCTQINSAAFL